MFWPGDQTSDEHKPFPYKWWESSKLGEGERESLEIVSIMGLRQEKGGGHLLEGKVYCFCYFHGLFSVERQNPELCEQ